MMAEPASEARELDSPATAVPLVVDAVSRVARALEMVPPRALGVLKFCSVIRLLRIAEEEPMRIAGVARAERDEPMEPMDVVPRRAMPLLLLLLLPTTEREAVLAPDRTLVERHGGLVELPTREAVEPVLLDPMDRLDLLLDLTVGSRRMAELLVIELRLVELLDDGAMIREEGFVL
jgi:hypothetical protein